MSETKETVAAAAVIDVMMNGDKSWRDRLADSDFLESADWATASAYARAAIEATTVKGDGQAADTITTLKGEIERRDAALKEADDFICKWAHREDENARFVVMSIRQALSQGTDNVG